MTTALKQPAWVSLLAHGVLLMGAFICLLPLLWMISTSLKTNEQLFPRATDQAASVQLKDWIPRPVHWANYSEALGFVPFGTYLQNTLFLCIVTVLGVTVSCSLVAYGFSRTQFKGRTVLFLLMISTLMLPPQVTMIPVFILYRTLGLYNTFLPLIIPSFVGVPFFVFLMTQFFRTIPKELSEAARIDGCNEFRIYWNVILPLSGSVLVTCGLFQFIHVWNDFFGPLIYLNDPAKYTLAYGLQQFQGSFGSEWAHLMAGATIFTMPIIVLFFLAQRTFIQGIATTGLK